MPCFLFPLLLAALAGAFEAVYGRRDNGWPIFILIDRALAPKAGTYDYCARRADK